MTELAKTIWRLHRDICRCQQKLSDRRIGPTRTKALKDAIRHDTKELEHQLRFVGLRDDSPD